MTRLLKTKPMKHQTRGLKRVKSRPRTPSDEDVFAWLMEMGTGKTWCAIAEFAEYVAGGDIVDMLVVAPAGSYKNWIVDKDPDDPQYWCELRKHLPEKTFKSLSTHLWESGNSARAKKQRELFLRNPDSPRVIVMNVEALSKAEAAMDMAVEFLRQRPTLMIVDESTRIKNPKAKRTKNVKRLGEMAVARRIMTGWLTPQGPLDVYAQFEFLDWRILGFKSYFAFRNRYAITRKEFFGSNPRPVEVVVGYKNLDELRDKIAPYSFRVLKEECLDLDPKVYTTWEVKPTEEQRRLYNEMKNFAMTQIEEEAHASASIVLAQMMRMHQILCGHLTDEEGNIHEIPSNRINDLIEILEGHRGKAIVWTHYVPALKKIVEELEEHFGEGCTAQFHGENKKTRHNDERKFLTDKKCLYMVATQGAGGLGNTWVNADLVVYFSNGDNLEHRLQSEDRAHRKGQLRRVTYVDMMVPNSVEVKIVKSMRNKINMSTEITGENYKEWLV